MNEENISRVILIRSESIPVVEAKLAVYRKYKHLINKRKLILHHVYEDYDDVAKLIAYERLSSVCVLVESLVNIFTIGLSEFSKELKGKQPSEDIQKLCHEVFNRTKDEAVGLVKCNIYQNR